MSKEAKTTLGEDAPDGYEDAGRPSLDRESPLAPPTAPPSSSSPVKV